MIYRAKCCKTLINTDGMREPYEAWCKCGVVGIKDGSAIGFADFVDVHTTKGWKNYIDFLRWSAKEEGS